MIKACRNWVVTACEISHSTGSSAAAEVLTSVFGDNFAYTDTSELEFGIASRSFKSFREAAEENNMARFYGGIHFHPTCIVSTVYGRKVGDAVVDKLHMKKQGWEQKKNVIVAVLGDCKN